MSDTHFGEGPYHLSARALDTIVTRNCPGTFLLGEHTDDGFHVGYVGRSDTDVNARLHGHVGKYRHFRFDYTTDAEAAFAEECSLYHEYLPEHNTAHPVPPPDAGWSCLHCTRARLTAA